MVSSGSPSAVFSEAAPGREDVGSLLGIHARKLGTPSVPLVHMDTGRRPHPLPTASWTHTPR